MRFSLLCRGRRSFFYCGERERMGAMSQRGNRWTREPQEARLGRETAPDGAGTVLEIETERPAGSASGSR